MRAEAVERRPARRSTVEAGDILRTGTAVLLMLGAAALVLMQLAPLWLLAAYLMLGLVSFGVYGFDKRAARNGDWRVSESSLHGIDLIGGIAGGLAAQVTFRHKTRKQGFVVHTALIALLHLAAMATLLFGLWHLPEILFAL